MAIQPVAEPYTKALDGCYVTKEVCGHYFTKNAFRDMSGIEFVFKTTLNPFIKGAVIGTTVGAATGVIIGTVTAGPPGALVGAGKGAAIGLIIGVAGAAVTFFVIRDSSPTKPFMEKEVNKNARNIFIEFHEDEKGMDEFICPLTLQPFEEPMIDKYGNTYDKEAITRWINENKDKDGYAVDPLRNGRICLKDLRKDSHTKARQYVCYSKLIKREKDNPNFQPEVRNGLSRIVRDMEKEVSKYIQNSTIEMLKALRSGKITPMEYGMQLAKFTNSLGI